MDADTRWRAPGQCVILTTEEAADMLGVTTARVRQLVASGDLRPIASNPGHRFWLLDVADCQVARRTQREVARLDDLAARLRDLA